MRTKRAYRSGTGAGLKRYYPRLDREVSNEAGHRLQSRRVSESGRTHGRRIGSRATPRSQDFRTDVEQYAAYREINSLMARAVLRFARPDAMFWIHDYHYLTLGSELRRLGIDQPVGFFLHTPFPVRNTMVSLPHHRELVRAMLCYDLIGFQTEEDLANFADYLQQELGLTGPDSFTTQQGVTRLGTFPIGIDVESFAERAVKSATPPDVPRLRSSLQGARLVIGVDRVD